MIHITKTGGMGARMKEITWSDRLHYQFDNFMAKGTAALIGGLGILSIIVIVIAAAVISLLSIVPDGGERMSFSEAAWASLMRTLDAGTMGGDTGIGYRIVMFWVTIGGIFIVSSLIGVLTSGLESKMEQLQKGRSRVIETNHTVILGWSMQIYSILSELIEANINQPKSCIMILGELDKVEMEEKIRAKLTMSSKMRIVCRSGSPVDLNDLQLASLNTSKSIIVLSPEKENPDADVIKTILAITNDGRRRPEPYHIVAEIRDPKNLDVARMVGRDEVELVLVGDLVSRIIAQTCRQSGLSIVYTELLDFGGDEIYFKSEPALSNKSFGEVLTAYDTSSVIGICQLIGNLPITRLNPPMDYCLQPGDQVIAISADDDTVLLSGFSDLNIVASAIQPNPIVELKAERTLILGWNWRAPTIIRELDHYVAPGSEVTVVSIIPESEVDPDAVNPDANTQTITYLRGDTTDRRTLEGLQIQTYDHIVVLSYSDHLNEQDADSNTLITLLHLRDMSEQLSCDFAIVSEMQDVRNRNLAEVTHADDFIVSDKLISLMLSQVSENKRLNAVFTDIFDSDGSEIYLKPAEDYIKPGIPVNFYTVIESARRRGEIAIGYRVFTHCGDAEKSYGVRVNPKKSEMITFAQRDRIILIADD
jgi:voltage-gated potassium channel Kch